MIKLKDLGPDEIEEAIRNKEFNSRIISSNKKVIVILSQDWCSQWSFMERYLKEMKDSEIKTDDYSFYIFIYNKSVHYDEFLNMKENDWSNREIPYLRYYQNGKLVKESNYVGKDTIIKFLNTPD
jgi:hypothetical protein